MTNIKPLGNLLLIDKITTSEKKTASGLVLAGESAEQTLSRATIVGIGPGERNKINGQLMTLDTLNVGMVVWYHENHATEVEDDLGKKYYFINSDTIFGYEG